MRENTNSRCGYVYDSEPYSHCCWRETRENSEKCVLHDTKSEKSSGEIISAIWGGVESPYQDEKYADSAPEKPKVLLDGADLSNLDLSYLFVNLSGYKIYLRDSSLENSWCSDGIVPSETVLSSANLRGFEVDNIRPTEAKRVVLDNAMLQGAVIKNTEFRNCSFQGANLGRTDFSNSVFVESNLSDISIHYASTEKIPVIAPDAEFRNCNMQNMDFSGSNLKRVRIKNSNIRNSDLSQCNINEVNFQDTEVCLVDFTESDLTRAGFEDTTLSFVDLTKTLLDGAYADSESSFFEQESYYMYDPKLSEKHRETVSEAKNIDIDDPDPLRAARVYKKLELVFQNSVLPRQQSRAFVKRQEMIRSQLKREEDWQNYIFASVSKTVFLYGESIKRIILTSGSIILAFSVLYYIFGSNQLSEPPTIYNSIAPEWLLRGIDSVYTSMLIFTTLGLGDYEPVNVLGRLIVTIEAALGAILIAIFVFVLGRRSSR